MNSRFGSSRRAFSVLALSLAALLVAAGCGGGDGDASAPESDPQTTSDAPAADGADFCAAYTDLGPLLLLAGLASAVGADSADADVNPVAFLSMIYAERFERFYASAADAVEEPLRSKASAVADVYASAPDRLRAAGLTDEQIDELAELDVTTMDDDEITESATDSDNVDQDALSREVSEFSAELSDVTGAAEAADDGELEALLATCGAEAAGGVDVCALLSDADASDLLGVDASASDESGGITASAGCTWSTGSDDDDPVLTILVSASDDFDTFHRDASAATGYVEIDDLGDAAYAIDGYSSTSNFSSDGRTLYVKVGARTLTVSSQLGDEGGLTDDELIGVAEQVLPQLR